MWVCLEFSCLSTDFWLIDVSFRLNILPSNRICAHDHDSLQLDMEFLGFKCLNKQIFLLVLSGISIISWNNLLEQCHQFVNNNFAHKNEPAISFKNQLIIFKLEKKKWCFNWNAMKAYDWNGDVFFGVCYFSPCTDKTFVWHSQNISAHRFEFGQNEYA